LKADPFLPLGDHHSNVAQAIADRVIGVQVIAVQANQVVVPETETPIVHQPITDHDDPGPRDHVVLPIFVNCKSRFRNFARHSKKCATK